MQGMMMNMPLTITSIIRHAERVYPRTEIVSVTHDDPRHRYCFTDAFLRIRKLANAFQSLGVEQGDRIGTLAWNDYRHFELYFGAPAYGAVCHTVNPRLFPEQISYIINHAGDGFLFVDIEFVGLLEKIQPELSNVCGYVLLTSEEHMPETTLKNVYCYESLLEAADEEFNWPELDETSASGMCYTSGTTGNPKGVLYTHRSNVLHAMMTAMVDTLAISIREVVMPVVPMFHANAWGAPYVCAMIGAKLVLPGPKAGNGEVMTDLINTEKVSYAMGVPTIWLNLSNYLEDSGEKVDTLKRIIVGGAACPLSLQKSMDNYGVNTQTAWGMTETGPVASYNQLLPWMEALPEAEYDERRITAGRGVYGVEMKLVDDEGVELPWDGETSGMLKVRGYWVASSYFDADNGAAHDEDGWFDTGDVATIDEYGYVKIVDRSKDVIKSGGEWISSIDVENAVIAHPAIMEAAVVGIPDPKWSERPMLFAVRNKDAKVDEAEVLKFLDGKIAKWWIPDICMFVDEIPHTATGKIDKKVLRKQYAPS